jgi:hypothetical protein
MEPIVIRQAKPPSVSTRNAAPPLIVAASMAAYVALGVIYGAHADELQANQRLLNAPIDQLAAVGQQPGAGAMFSVDGNPGGGQPIIAGSFPRSILIPGTDTSIKIYGAVTEVLDYWMSGASPNPGTPANSTVGANGQLGNVPLHNTVASARGDGFFQQTPRESKIGVETRTPTPFGEVRTVFEFDWAGSTAFAPGGSDPTSVSDNLLPRLRFAYGTIGGLLAGQATSNFSDPDANAETLDFGGNVGEPGHVRIPQVRWTMPVGEDSSLSVSAEQPETIIATPAGLEANDAGVAPTATTSCTAGAPAAASAATSTCSTTLLTSGNTPLNIAKTTAPDFTAAWYSAQRWGHVDLSAVLRPGIDVTDGHYFDHQYIGYGGHLGFDFRPTWFGWYRDDFTLHFEGGDTIGPYINESHNFDLASNYGAPGGYGSFMGPSTAAAAAPVRFKPTQEIGAEIGYQHWWTGTLRSNINAGFNAHYGFPSNLIGVNAGIDKEMITAHVNLIWAPMSSVGIGLEYMWGQRTVQNNSTGTENVLISRFIISF